MEELDVKLKAVLYTKLSKSTLDKLHVKVRIRLYRELPNPLTITLREEDYLSSLKL